MLGQQQRHPHPQPHTHPEPQADLHNKADGPYGPNRQPGEQTCRSGKSRNSKACARGGRGSPGPSCSKVGSCVVLCLWAGLWAASWLPVVGQLCMEQDRRAQRGSAWLQGFMRFAQASVVQLMHSPLLWETVPASVLQCICISAILWGRYSPSLPSGALCNAKKVQNTEHP